MNSYDYHLQIAHLVKIMKVYLDSVLAVSNCSGVGVYRINHQVNQDVINPVHTHKAISKLYENKDNINE